MTHSHDTATPSLSVESEYVLVPREPSEAMLRDGVMAWTMPWADVIPQDIDEDRFILAAVYRAMLAAAPAPNPSPAAKGGEAEALANYDGWRSIDTAPEDESVILSTTGGHVGEALMLVDEDTGQQKWTWAGGPVSKFHQPLGWMPMPKALSKPVLSDLRNGGFDGPTGAD